jgi:hypothetical protein
MDRYWMANVSSTPPDMTGGTKGYPQDGDVTAGLAATRPGAALFHAVVMEIINAQIAGGVTADKTTLNQLAVAISNIANAAAAAAQAAAIAAATGLASAARTGAVSDVNAEFSHSLGTAAGYQVLPSGQIHMWVELAVSGAANVAVPITYPNGGFTNTAGIPQVTVFDSSRNAGNSSDALIVSVSAKSLAGCTVVLGQNGGGARDVTVRVDVWGT